MKTKLSLITLLAGFLLLMTVPGQSETNHNADYDDFSSEEVESLSKTKTSYMDNELAEEEEFNKHVSSLENEVLPEEISPEEPPIEPESSDEKPSEDL